MVGFVSVLALLGLLALAVGLGGAGWATGVACGLFVNGALARGLAHHGSGGLGPAGRVTLTRAVLVCGIAALTADSFGRSTPVATLVGLTVVALALDAVDGKVARRTGTVSALGARFDMEIDAFLILVLSVYVAPAAGWWVLTIGLARYALLLAERMLPWLRRPVPPRHWRKWVAAIQGIVLVVAAAGVLPAVVSEPALLVALALLAESFGRDVWWLWRQRNSAELPVVADRWPGTRVVVGRMATVGACLTVWFVLVLPNEVTRVTPAAFVRIPLEGLLLLALGLVLPSLARRVFAVAIGLVLGLLVVVKVLDMGFNEVMDRPFDPVNDWGYLGPGYGVLGDSIGSTGALVTAVVAGLLVVGVLVLMPAAVGRLTRLPERHRMRSLGAVAVLGVAWAVCAASGLQVEPGANVASTTALNLAVSEVGQVRDGIQDRETFAKQIADDDYRDVPANRLLTGLRGKDVLLVFVESYGRVAVQDSDFSPEIQAVLDNGTDRLRAAGFDSRSAFLTSPTFGAASWLAHSSMQSGLWVNSQRRYNQLVQEDRTTLTSAFRRAGWRTVFDVPAITHDWPEGDAFYGFDKLYDFTNIPYAGPKFGYANLPDQYTLDTFRRLELAPADRKPVMAELDLESSHHPWAPLPRMVDWHELGDGSIFNGMPEEGESAEEVFRDSDDVRNAYGESIEYTLNSLISFVETYPDPDLVLVVLGDHQPHSYVSGHDVGHDVPISVIAHDPAVLDRISNWDWDEGLHPTPDAPVWKMDSFRDHFLDSYGPLPSVVE